MKISNTSQRLKAIMKERNLKQIDILNLAKPYCEKYDIKLTKVDLSQYVSGKVEPGQAKLFVLAMCLNVSEAWLMGLDVSSQPSLASNLDAELYSIGQSLETLDERVAFYSNFHRILNILGYSLSTNWKTDSFGNTIDLLEDKEYVIEVPHSEIKEIMNSSRSFILFHIRQLFSNFEKKPRNKEFDDMSDEAFEQYFSDEAIPPKDNIIPIAEEPVPDHLAVQAAHNDSIIDDEELSKMQRDMEMLKKYRK